MANTSQDLKAKLASSPEVLLLDATIFDGPPQLIDALTSITGAVYLIVPGGVKDDLLQQIRSVPSVKDVKIGDVNIADFTARAYADALALRKTLPVSSAVWAGGNQQRGSGGVGGLRIVTVWSRSGGAGKTTIAVALGQAVARRGVKTLLIGLGAPDPLPLQLGLRPEPNILSWMSNPTDEGLRTSIQAVGDLHVLAGFPDIMSEGQGDQDADQKSSINELVTSAAYSGYSAIILDTPSAGAVTPRALSAANTWLMVGRPTVADAWMSVESFRTVTQKIAGQHRITPGNIFVVLNQRQNGQLTADQWHSAADSACRKLSLNVGFPPVMAVLPFSPDIPLSQDNARTALDSSDEVARPIHRLAEMLFGGAAASSSNSGKSGEGSVINFGPLKIRTRK
jgi:cellulose biosynthesis protein BcsQ